MRCILISICLCAMTTPTFAESPIVLKLSRQEANILHNLLDSAVKGGGLDAARTFVPIDDKLGAAAHDAQEIDLTAEARAKVEAADKAKVPTSP
jgi:hypothetical protein